MTDTEIRVFHMFGAIGGGAKGFKKARPGIGAGCAHFRCVGSVDVDAAANRDFARLVGPPTDFRGDVSGNVIGAHERQSLSADMQPECGRMDAAPKALIYRDCLFGSADGSAAQHRQRVQADGTGALPSILGKVEDHAWRVMCVNGIRVHAAFCTLAKLPGVCPVERARRAQRPTNDGAACKFGLRYGSIGQDRGSNRRGEGQNACKTLLAQPVVYRRPRSGEGQSFIGRVQRVGANLGLLPRPVDHIRVRDEGVHACRVGHGHLELHVPERTNLHSSRGHQRVIGLFDSKFLRERHAGFSCAKPEVSIRAPVQPLRADVPEVDV